MTLWAMQQRLCSWWLSSLFCFLSATSLAYRHPFFIGTKSYTRPSVMRVSRTDASREPLRIVEFFSGIGGWASAFKSLVDLEYDVVAAYDVNMISNEVYEHVYGSRPSSTSIESLSLKVLESLAADVWVRNRLASAFVCTSYLTNEHYELQVMSPPCQPFTRQHPATEKDPRGNALMHLIRTVAKMKNLPKYLALENVIGFEESHTCSTLLDTLESIGYNCMQFSLSPTQFGVPNERPRYYLLAVLNGTFPDCVSSSAANTVNSADKSGAQSEEQNHSSNVVTGSALTSSSAVNNTDKDSRYVRTCIPGIENIKPKQLLNYLSDVLSLPEIENLLLSEQLLQKNASWCLDIVTSNDTYTSCFTKSYSKYFKGTGSVLLIPDPHNTISDIKELCTPHGSVDIAKSVIPSDSRIELGLEFGSFPGPGSTLESPLGQEIENGVNGPIESSHSVSDSKDVTSADFREAPETRVFDMNWKDKLKGKKLRFFSPNELLRLFGFLPLQTNFIPARPNLKRRIEAIGKEEGKEIGTEIESTDDQLDENSAQLIEQKTFFPPNVTNRKCYELIGNSLSVTVVSHLLEYMLRSKPHPSSEDKPMI